jgi:hypothetical protein
LTLFFISRAGGGPWGKVKFTSRKGALARAVFQIAR